VATAPTPRRYYVRSPDGASIAGFDQPESAKQAALAYGDGAHVIDTLAQAYHPMLQEVSGGELGYAGYGGWDSGRHGLDYDLIEAIKKGHVALVHAFLAKGASANAKDRQGSPALLWAIGSGHGDCVRLLLDSGADPNAKDAAGLSAMALARRKNRADLLDILSAGGTSEEQAR
jgi:hypothetical protein